VITLRNTAGASAEILARGAIVRTLHMPDRHGHFADVVLGYETLGDYENDLWYLGTVVGRYAGRIREGRFAIGDVAYQLPVNNGRHHLHGGPAGFHAQDWTLVAHEAGAATFALTSPHLSEGYPGELHAEVTYRLTDANEFVVSYHATTDRPTVINLTQHTYFNLAGRGDILDHELRIDADMFLPIDAEAIPLGEPAAVAGTPFDFRQPRRIRDGLSAGHAQLGLGAGYDHCFVLNQPKSNKVIAELYEANTGRTMRVRTSEPGMQLYIGQYLAPVPGKGRVNERYAGICLETQHFPDSPNRPQFPSTLLQPSEVFTSTTSYEFGTRD
jgi:aldose 1-epimerase